MGFEAVDTENRARLFLYYPVDYPMVFADQSPELQDRLVEQRHSFLTEDAVEK